MKTSLKSKVVHQMDSVIFIPLLDPGIHFFKSAIEKADYIRSHPDSIIHRNYAFEPLYILFDTSSAGFVLNKTGVTYNEAIELLKHYF